MRARSSFVGLAGLSSIARFVRMGVEQEDALIEVGLHLCRRAPMLGTNSFAHFESPISVGAIACLDPAYQRLN
jgi:hypothetical protein